MPDQPLVHIVDPDGAARDLLRATVESVGLHAAAYASLDDFRVLCTAATAGCLLLDVAACGPSGLDLQLELMARGCDLPVIVITAHNDVAAVTRAFRQGAADCFQQPFDLAQLVASIRTAMRRDAQAQELRIARAAIAARVATLSPRELQVLDLITAGFSHKQIAAKLSIAERTVEYHRARVMAKMGVESLVHLVRVVLLLRGTEPPSSVYVAPPRGEALLNSLPLLEGQRGSGFCAPPPVYPPAS
jgi:two-component system, LuxR family, response regulator FixJ